MTHSGLTAQLPPDFVRTIVPGLLKHFLSVTLKDLLKGAVVLSAAQRQHMIAVGHIPPRSRAFEAHVTDEFIGGLNAATAQRIAGSAPGTIVDAAVVILQVAAEGVDCRS